MDTVRIDVTVRYLEMLKPEELRSARAPEIQVEVTRAEIPSPEMHRFLYTAVGGDWFWTERLGWDHAAWKQYVDRPELQIWVASVSGTIAGYAELEAQRDGNVELVHFGLLPQFIGRGLGGHLLTFAVRRAWAIDDTRRVWVHTCSLDGPHAVANYQARGFRVYQEVTESKEMPTKAPGPWPGARP